MGALTRWILVGLVTLAAAGAVPAAGQTAGGVPFDSSAVQLRAPGDGALERYREDPAYDYQEGGPREPSWWARLWQRFVDEVLAPLLGAQDGRVAKWGLLLALAVVLVLALLQLLKVDFGGAFRGRAARTAPGGAEDELEAMATPDVQAAVEDAEAEGAYRRAVRLRYLLLLRELDARGLIEARPEKTNRQYVDAVRGTPLHADFQDLTALFEYVWYGEVELGADRYESLRHRFERLHQQVGHEYAEARRAEGAHS